VVGDLYRAGDAMDTRQEGPDARSSGAAPEEAPRPYTPWDVLPIGGRWRQGRAGKRAADRDPYSGETLLELPLASASDVDEAYRGAQRAQRSWAAALPQERCDVLERSAQLLARRKEEVIGWLVREAGSTRIKAEVEWQLVHRGLRDAASFPFRMEGRILPAGVSGEESRVYRDPAGVVGVVSPWNFPLHLSNRSVAPALALGNAVVVKPASDTPVTGGLLLARIFEEAGLPPGVLSVVVGAGSEIGDAFVEHPIPRVISFTGTTAVGRRVGERAGRAIKRVCLELGGNGPFVVLDDADLERAVDAAIVGKFLHQGQCCLALNRILVDARRHDEFLEVFARRVAALKVGDPSDPSTVIGPIINKRQLDAVERKVDATLARGARAVVRGQVKGLVLPPIVLSDVTPDMPAARDELLGPVAPVLRFGSDDQALRLANATEYGLSCAVFTRDLVRGVRFARAIEAGMAHVNDTPVHYEPNAAFGGEKASGVGRVGGAWALREFTTDRWISVQEQPRAYPF
jgi:aldehyde dehydrogenase (NAD+)